MAPFIQDHPSLPLSKITRTKCDFKISDFHRSSRSHAHAGVRLGHLCQLSDRSNPVSNMNQ
eukprot:672051-Pelagomonas_calceolata.AAC.1